MKHPGPLLVDYVDDTLAPDRRAEVDAHLGGCATCRAEVALARSGRGAAASLPRAKVPVGVADEAIAEAGRLAREQAPGVTPIRSGGPTTPRWFAALGVAAVLLLGILIVPKLGQPGANPASMESAGGAAARPAVPTSKATAVEFQRADYGAESLQQRVALAFGRVPQEATVGGATLDSSSPQSLPAGFRFASADKLLVDRLPEAERCLASAYPTDGVLHRVILARYDGTPAYIGLYLQGPGAGLPPERVLVVVAATDGCTLLVTQQIALP